jgi:hypothetical protein
MYNHIKLVFTFTAVSRWLRPCVFCAAVGGVSLEHTLPLSMKYTTITNALVANNVPSPVNRVIRLLEGSDKRMTGRSRQIRMPANADFPKSWWNMKPEQWTGSQFREHCICATSNRDFVFVIPVPPKHAITQPRSKPDSLSPSVRNSSMVMARFPSSWIMDGHPGNVRPKGFRAFQDDPWITWTVQLDLMDHNKMPKMEY